jgi:AcrR family transcriptional regulator
VTPWGSCRAACTSTSPGRKTESAAGRRSPAREAIFEAATRLFGERGYPGTSIRDIANRDRLLAKRGRYEEFFVRTLRAEIVSGAFAPDLDVKVYVLSVLGALNWTPKWFTPDGPASPEEIADARADGLLRGAQTRV